MCRNGWRRNCPREARFGFFPLFGPGIRHVSHSECSVRGHHGGQRAGAALAGRTPDVAGGLALVSAVRAGHAGNCDTGMAQKTIFHNALLVIPRSKSCLGLVGSRSGLLGAGPAPRHAAVPGALHAYPGLPSPPWPGPAAAWRARPLARPDRHRRGRHSPRLLGRQHAFGHKQGMGARPGEGIGRRLDRLWQRSRRVTVFAACPDHSRQCRKPAAGMDLSHRETGQRQ